MSKIVGEGQKAQIRKWEHSDRPRVLRLSGLMSVLLVIGGCSANFTVSGEVFVWMQDEHCEDVVLMLGALPEPFRRHVTPASGVWVSATDSLSSDVSLENAEDDLFVREAVVDADGRFVIRGIMEPAPARILIRVKGEGVSDQAQVLIIEPMFGF